EAAYQYGAEVTLVTTSALNASKAIERVQVDSAKAMFEAIDERFDDLDILIMAAAVSDYGVAHPATSKMKKEDYSKLLNIELKEKKSILSRFCGRNRSFRRICCEKISRKEFRFDCRQ